jgi:hypothetical protein
LLVRNYSSPAPQGAKLSNKIQYVVSPLLVPCFETVETAFFLFSIQKREQQTTTNNLGYCKD